METMTFGDVTACVARWAYGQDIDNATMGLFVDYECRKWVGEELTDAWNIARDWVAFRVDSLG